MHKDKNMNSVPKSRPNSQNVRSFQRISYQQLSSTVPRHEQSYIIVNSIDNDHSNDSLTRSILIDNAAQQRGFLPYDYRIKNTFESIYRQRTFHKPSSKLPLIRCSSFNRSSTHLDVFGNSTSSMTKLAEQRLILREKIIKKKHNTTSVPGKRENAFHTMSDADFVTDIPNALESVLKNTKRLTIEWHILETLKRERLKQARYRLLPVNQAPYD